MKSFHCDNCKMLVFFESFKCVSCEHVLAYNPQVADIITLKQDHDLYLRVNSSSPDKKEQYRLCSNYAQHNVCNWAIPVDDPNSLCLSCRLTRVIPDLTIPQNKSAWFKLEMAKRRLIYSLLNLQLPVISKIDDPQNGVEYEFKADVPGTPVLTGHEFGLITVNIAEADDAEREKRRVNMHEPYRTMLGHFRHEIGHYYWDRLVAGHPRLTQFRELFGDETKDYNQALVEYYKTGAPQDWQERYISAYSTAHPWEDWAETWAHYLHMVDALEMADYTGLSLKPKRQDEPILSPETVVALRKPNAFDKMITKWIPLTYILNNLNRGLGLKDGYPFVLTNAVIDKLRFIHTTIAEK